MNYPAMRWVASEDCQVKGPGRALLWVVAYHADRDTGECWVGQRRLAREAGLARSTVQVALDRLFADGVLEWIEDSRGPKPERFQIAPGWVEGEASASGVVEGHASAAHLVEGQASIAPSGPAPGPQAIHGNFLVDRSAAASGPAGGPAAPLVDRFTEVTGPETSGGKGGLTSAKSDSAESQGYKHGSELQVKNHVREVASSAADAAGNLAAVSHPNASELAKQWEAAVLERDPGAKYEPPAFLEDLNHQQVDGWMLSNGHFLPSSVAPGWCDRRPVEPPPVPDSLKAELERRGLRPKARPSNGLHPVGTPTMSQEEQLAALERMIAEEAAKGETA